jgi:AsmA protein
MMRSMPQRLKWVALCAVVLASALAGAYRWPISSTWVAAAFNRQLASAAGVELRGPARVYLSILPTPSVQIVDVELRGKDGATLVTATKARAGLAASRLLFGDLRFTSLVLREPTALVDLDKGPFAREGELGKLLGLSGDAAAEAPIGGLRLEHGLLHIVSAARGLDSLIEDIDGEVDWSNLAGALSADLRGNWRGQELALDFRLAAPIAWLTGGATAASLNLSARDLSLALNGELTDGGANFVGALAADAASISALTRLAGAPSIDWLPDGRLSLRGKARANILSLTISDMRLTAFDEKYDGAVAVNAKGGGAATLTGSLAAEKINLDDFLSKAPPLIDKSGGWSEAPISIALPKGLDLDLRVSAATIGWRGHAIEDAAFSLMSADGGVKATLSEARAYKGVLKGVAAAVPAPGGASELSVSASLTNADIGALLADFGANSYSGMGDLEAAVRSTGASVAGLAGALSGDASIKLGAGVIDGLSLEEALRRSERRPINIFSDMRTGRTNFDETLARAAIHKGEARLLSGVATGPGVYVTLSGTADLANRALAAQLIATRADQHGATDPEGPQLKMTIVGPWSRPIIRSDSGA